MRGPPAVVQAGFEHGEVRAGHAAGGLPGPPHHCRVGHSHRQARGGGAELSQASG